MVFPRELPAAAVTEFARRLDGRVDDFWVIEDCFFTGGVSLAAAAAAVTEQLTVGIGIMPAVLRNPALTAMELATLAGIAPGRIVGGIGHGVQSWMAQAGAKPASPVTALREVLDVVRRLLAGETLDVDGDYVHLRDVALVAPPPSVPRVLAGVRQPRSLAVAGEVADGVLLAETSGPAAIADAWARTGHSPEDPDFEIAVFAPLSVADDRMEARRSMAPLIGELLTERSVSILHHPAVAEMTARWETDGPVGLVTMPDDWWTELAPVGTLDDAAAFIDGVTAAGASRVLLFPAADLGLARTQIDDVLELAN